jgi:hypothetical protein
VSFLHALWGFPKLATCLYMTGSIFFVLGSLVILVKN